MNIGVPQCREGIQDILVALPGFEGGEHGEEHIAAGKSQLATNVLNLENRHLLRSYLLSVQPYPRHIDDSIRREEPVLSGQVIVFKVHDNQIIRPIAGQLFEAKKRVVLRRVVIRAKVKAMSSVDDSRNLRPAEEAKGTSADKGCYRGVDVNEIIAAPIDDLEQFARHVQGIRRSQRVSRPFGFPDLVEGINGLLACGYTGRHTVHVPTLGTKMAGERQKEVHSSGDGSDNKKAWHNSSEIDDWVLSVDLLWLGLAWETGDGAGSFEELTIIARRPTRLG
jgi:hypothetical protein